MTKYHLNCVLLKKLRKVPAEWITTCSYFQTTEKLIKIRKDPNDLDIMPYISPNRPYLTVEEDVLGLEIGLHFLYSQKRNLWLKNVANSFKRKYGIKNVPIFVGRTALEESIFKHEEETLKL